MLNGQLYYDGFPQFSQMVGGVHTENGVYNAKVFCEGVKLYTGNVYGDASPVHDRSRPTGNLASGSHGGSDGNALVGGDGQGVEDPPSRRQRSGSVTLASLQQQGAAPAPGRQRSGSVSVASATSDEHGPLPKGWVVLKNQAGRTYYQNNLTRTTQWERPVHPRTTPGLPDGWQRCTTPKSVANRYLLLLDHPHSVQS